MSPVWINELKITHFSELLDVVLVEIFHLLESNFFGNILTFIVSLSIPATFKFAVIIFNLKFLSFLFQTLVTSPIGLYDPGPFNRYMYLIIIDIMNLTDSLLWQYFISCNILKWTPNIFFNYG